MIDEEELAAFKKLTKTSIKCCSWYREHVKGVGKLTPDQLEWLSNLPAVNRQTMMDFPIYSVVQSACGVSVAFPYSHILAIVAGYKNGYVLVRDKPGGEVSKYIRPDQLSRVGNWRGMTGKKLKNAIDWHLCKTKKESK